MNGEELLPENAEAWEFAGRFPSLLIAPMGGYRVEYQPAERIAERNGYSDPMLMEKLEAICRGLSAKAKGRRRPE